MQAKAKPNVSAGNYTAIESFGVKVSIYSSRTDLVEETNRRLSAIIPENFFKKISPHSALHRFSIRQNKSYKFVLFKGRKKIDFGNNQEFFFRYLESQIRLTIAEFAKAKVFLHAGVVGWKGKAIIIPANSFQGKTTLVKELTKMGASYYSDEYAVLDENGFVHPFPKMLSIRGEIDEYQQKDYPVEYFGGLKGKDPLPVGMFLITNFEPDAKWQPQILTEGEGILELLSHTFPIRYNPKFSLNVLNKTVNRAIIVKTKRGEAKDFAATLLRFFEDKVL